VGGSSRAGEDLRRDARVGENHRQMIISQGRKDQHER